MKQWPEKHKGLAAIILLYAVACAGFYFFQVRPKIDTVQGVISSLDELRNKLKGSGWPLNASRLTTLHEEYQKKLSGTKRKRSDGTVDGGIEARSERVLTLATSMFTYRIESIFGSTRDFMNEVSRLDYQEEFSQLEQRLAVDGVVLAEKVFGLSEDTADIDTYQLLLKVWTVDALVRLIQKTNLSIVKERIPVPTGTGRDVMASSIRVMPTVSYVLQEDDNEPYIMETPVKVTVRGTIDDFMLFLRSLNQDGNFLVLNRVEMFTENPNVAGKPGSNVTIQITDIQAVIECASFFRPSQEAPKMHINRAKVLPAGV